jgi:pyrroloquinoline quinone (PQQ) biosynthesis protein C
MIQPLRRSAPFLGIANGGPVASYRLDRLALAPGAAPGEELLRRVAATLDLSAVAESFPAEVATEVIWEQYEACLDYAYSHPVWRRFRSGEGVRGIHAYLLESRHYLHAAASRMAPGPAGSWRNLPATLHLVEHVVEEADHAIFFENGLAELGCDRAALAACRPSPVTLEWIYLMRSLAARDPLIAGVCSGLMESSAADKGVIMGWHDMVVENGLMPEPVMTAIFEHIKLDMELGHGGNWRDVVEAESPVTASRLSDCLNAVCAVSEMLYRWFDSLEGGLSAEAVALAAEIGVSPREGPLAGVDPMFNGVPVWPAEVLHHAAHGGDEPPGSREAVALAYHYDSRAITAGRVAPELAGAAACITGLAAEPGAAGGLEALARCWLVAIDGHRLWADMADDAVPESLIYGWLLENYHYLASAAWHVSAAVASTPDWDVRMKLVEHLEDEAEHGEILKRGLLAVDVPLELETSRPLPTTIAFVGCLHELGRQDWKAYALTIGFLQFSLTPGDSRHEDFYRTAAAAAPAAEPLLAAMRNHDTVDASEGHEGKIRDLLETIESRHRVGEESIARAAVAVQLGWSFLDGIRTHYSNGPAAVAQRAGWTAAL